MKKTNKIFIDISNETKHSRKLIPFYFEDFLRYMHRSHKAVNPLHRNIMSKVEIKIADALVNRGLLTKGVSREDARMKIYYCDDSAKVESVCNVRLPFIGTYHFNHETKIFKTHK